MEKWYGNCSVADKLKAQRIEEWAECGDPLHKVRPDYAEPRHNEPTAERFTREYEGSDRHIPGLSFAIYGKSENNKCYTVFAVDFS